MTDEEIRDHLVKADDLLRQYVEMVQPAAEALALLHDAATGTKHKGELGCHESGINTICLHIAEGEKRSDDDMIWLDSMGRLQGLFFAELKHISLDAYF